MMYGRQIAVMTGSSRGGAPCGTSHPAEANTRPAAGLPSGAPLGVGHGTVSGSFHWGAAQPRLVHVYARGGRRRQPTMDVPCVSICGWPGMGQMYLVGPRWAALECDAARPVAGTLSRHRSPLRSAVDGGCPGLAVGTEEIGLDHGIYETAILRRALVSGPGVLPQARQQPGSGTG